MRLIKILSILPLALTLSIVRADYTADVMFTDSEYNEIGPEYPAGTETVYFEVYDADITGSLDVVLTSDTDTEGETLTLNEVDGEAGYFRGSIPVGVASTSLLNEDLCQSRSPILKYAAINNSLQYKIGNKTEIINQLYKRLNNLEDCNYIIKYINTDFLNLDTKQFIKISSSLDYELLIKALKFIKVYDDKYLWDSIVDNCFKQSYISPKLISFLQNAEQTELFTFFKLKLLNKNYLIEKKLFINELMNHTESSEEYSFPLF